MVWSESRPETSVRKAIPRSNGTQIFLDEKQSAIGGGIDRCRSAVDRYRHGWRATERWDDPRGAGGDWNSFVFFNDTDGHGWILEERSGRA
jgi:hypothetical protein